MGCRCQERKAAIAAGASALARGNVRQVAQSAGYVGRTLVQDARSGELQRAALLRLASIAKRPR